MQEHALRPVDVANETVRSILRGSPLLGPYLTEDVEKIEVASAKGDSFEIRKKEINFETPSGMSITVEFRSLEDVKIRWTETECTLQKAQLDSYILQDVTRLVSTFRNVIEAQNLVVARA